jgi:hypothetical protein
MFVVGLYLYCYWKDIFVLFFDTLQDKEKED